MMLPPANQLVATAPATSNHQNPMLKRYQTLHNLFHTSNLTAAQKATLQTSLVNASYQPTETPPRHPDRIPVPTYQKVRRCSFPFQTLLSNFLCCLISFTKSKSLSDHHNHVQLIPQVIVFSLWWSWFAHNVWQLRRANVLYSSSLRPWLTSQEITFEKFTQFFNSQRIEPGGSDSLMPKHAISYRKGSPFWELLVFFEKSCP